MFGMQASTLSKERNSWSYVYNRVNKACPCLSNTVLYKHMLSWKWYWLSNIEAIPGNTEKVFVKEFAHNLIKVWVTLGAAVKESKLLLFFFLVHSWLSAHCADILAQIPKAEYWLLALFPGLPSRTGHGKGLGMRLLSWSVQEESLHLAGVDGWGGPVWHPVFFIWLWLNETNSANSKNLLKKHRTEIKFLTWVVPHYWYMDKTNYFTLCHTCDHTAANNCCITVAATVL